MNETEMNKKKSEEVLPSEEIIAKFNEQIYRLEEDLEQKNTQGESESNSLRENLYNSEKGKYKKKSLTGRYYQSLLRKNPMIYLLIIGGILGCIFSISLIFEICSGNLACWSQKWWWIPLSTLIIGPIGLVFIALILPFLPWILYIALYVIIHIGS